VKIFFFLHLSSSVIWEQVGCSGWACRWQKTYINAVRVGDYSSGTGCQSLPQRSTSPFVIHLIKTFLIHHKTSPKRYRPVVCRLIHFMTSSVSAACLRSRIVLTFLLCAFAVPGSILCRETSVLILWFFQTRRYNAGLVLTTIAFFYVFSNS
jgi:hypothetical protein